MTVLDASAVIAYLNPGDSHHRDAVGRIAAATDGLTMSALTLTECLVHPARTGRGPETLEILRAIGVSVVGLSEIDALHLADLRNRSGLRLPDAAVLFTALDGAAPLLTFDHQLAAAANAAGVVVVH